MKFLGHGTSVLLYYYFINQSKKRAGTVDGAFLDSAEGAIVGESKLWFSHDATVLAVEIQVFKEAIPGALQRDLREMDVYLDSRSTFEVLNNLVSRHRALAEIN